MLHPSGICFIRVDAQGAHAKFMTVYTLSRECNRISQRKHLSGVLEKEGNGNRSGIRIATDVEQLVLLV